MPSSGTRSRRRRSGTNAFAPSRSVPHTPWLVSATDLGLLAALVLAGAVISIADEGVTDPGATIGGLIAVALFGVVPAGLMMYFGIRGLAAKPT